jgi:hypothetical protein
MHSRFLRFGSSIAFAWTLAAGSHIVAADYPTTVAADNPLAYYRMNDSLARGNTNLNAGSLGAAASATNLNVRAYSGGIVGDRDRSQFYDSTARAIIPFQEALNPPADQAFTIEAWIYPASDQIGNGQAVIANRYVNSGESRQGWIIFQRAPNSTYTGKGGFEGVGWNFRMYSGSGGTTGLDITSDSPYEVGTWVYLAVTYLPQTDTNTQGLIIYTNGVEAKRTFWSGSVPAYQPNTGLADHAANPNGPAGLGFGSYNNTQPGSNPFFGAVDEFAFYTNALAPEKILAHYQNGTNSARATSYSALILADKPVEYLRFNEMPPRDNSVINLGEMRNTGYFTNYNVQWAAESALPESSDQSFAYHLGATSHTSIAFQDKLNPSEDIPMTIEFWVKADDDRINPGAAVMNNRYTLGTARTGWVIYQRAPNSSYSSSSQKGYEGVGYDLRMYTGSGTSSIDSKTSVPYKIGEWQHIVFNWEPNPDVGLGFGTLSCYVNGQHAGAFVDGQPSPQDTTGTYKANTNPSELGASADFTIGAYNGIGNFVQTFMGQVDEVAIYTNFVLTADQILAHYQAGTNAHPQTNYSSLVLEAPFQWATEFGPDLGIGSKERIGPVAYLRFNDPAPFPAANSGTLGAAADGAFQGSANNNTNGAQPPNYPGFDAGNLAGLFDGISGWLGFNNPAALNFSGPITLEALIRPDATQGAKARIISHGPEFVSLSDPLDPIPAAPAVSPEVFLKIEGGNYVVGSSDGTTTFSASAAVPAGDLGSTIGVVLAGTYDGTNWRLYRNGTQIAVAPAATGSVVVTNGDWAIGSAGNGWTDLFTGKIDEVAIYNTALSAAKIQAHYASIIASPISLSVAIVNGRPQITYSGGILKGATTVNGAFTTVTGASSPYTPPLGPTMMFYRVSTQ